MIAVNSLQERKLFVYLLGLVIIIPYIFIYLFTRGEGVQLEDVRILGSFALLQLLYALWSWHYLKNTWFDAYVIFTVSLYTFTLAQPILEALDCYSEYMRLWGRWGISALEYYDATFISMIGCGAFNYGAITSLKNSNHFTQKDKYSNYKSLDIIVKGAIFTAIITMPFYISILIKQIVTVSVIGYGGLYDMGDSSSRTEQILSAGFTPALLVLFTVSMLKRRYMKLTTFIVALLVFLPPLYIGGRSNAMIIFAIFFLVYLSAFGISKKKLIIIGLSAIGMLGVLYMVGQIRKSTDRSLESIAAVSETEDNPVTSTLEEMGWSMFPTIVSIRAIPRDIDYAYGKSFFWAALSMVPNLGFWDGEHPGKTNDPGTKLDRYVDWGYGIGYSIIAGTFSEFGYLGFLIMWVYGFIFTRILTNISPSILKNEPVKFILAILFLWFALKFVRNSFDSFVRSLAFYVLPYYLIYKYTIKQYRHNSKSKKLQYK